MRDTDNTDEDAAHLAEDAGAEKDRWRDPRLLIAAGALVLLAVVVCALVVPAACSTPSGEGQVPVVTGDGDDSAAEDGTADEDADPAAADENAAVSTPRDEWRQGEMPYLYQIDPQYANAVYSNGSFAKQGCGPTALSMVYIYLTGNTDLGPLEMADFATENGYSSFKEGSSWTLVSEGAEKLGLTVTELVADPAQLRAELEAGHPLICVMAPGTFTQVGHFIAVEGLDSEGKALVHDSNSVERSHESWDLSLICDEANAIWSLSVS